MSFFFFTITTVKTLAKSNENIDEEYFVSNCQR